MAQDQVSAATAEIISVKITNPTPTSFHVVQDGFSDSDSSFHPFLDAFNVSTSIAGSAAYGMVTLPGLTSDAHVPVHVEQDVQILDLQAFADYNIKVLTSETFEQRLNGTTTLTLGALPATSVSYDKTVTMNGKLYSSGIRYRLTGSRLQFVPRLQYFLLKDRYNSPTWTAKH